MIIAHYNTETIKNGIRTVGGVKPVFEYTTFPYDGSLIPRYARYCAIWMYDTESKQFIKQQTKSKLTNEELTWILLKAKPYK